MRRPGNHSGHRAPQVAGARGLSAIEDEILAQQLRALAPTRSGGRIPMFIAPNIHEATLTVEQPAEHTLAKARDAVCEHGHLLQLTEEAFLLRAVVGSGTWNMNPAVVTITAEVIADGQTRLNFRGVAREGIVKQRAGQQAVVTIIAAIRASQQV